MKIINWNLNHRVAKRKIPLWLSTYIAANTPTVLVLTEYVVGSDHDRFIKELYKIGLRYYSVSQSVSRQNQILIATKEPHLKGTLTLPSIHPAVPPNFLHVILKESGINIIGFRMPVFEKNPTKLKRQTWELILHIANKIINYPSIITGDFNTSPQDPKSKCGNYIKQITDAGWYLAPEKGFSWIHQHSGTKRKIDHAFVSPKLKVIHAEYNWDFLKEMPNSIPKIGYPDHAMLVVELQDT